MRIWMNRLLGALSKFKCFKVPEHPRKQKSASSVTAPTCRGLCWLFGFTKFQAYREKKDTQQRMSSLQPGMHL